MRIKILIILVSVGALWQGCAGNDLSLKSVEVQSERMTFLDPSMPEFPE